jgi:hypothetical protein
MIDGLLLDKEYYYNISCCDETTKEVANELSKFGMFTEIFGFKVQGRFELNISMSYCDASYNKSDSQYIVNLVEFVDRFVKLFRKVNGDKAGGNFLDISIEWACCNEALPSIVMVFYAPYAHDIAITLGQVREEYFDNNTSK